MSYSLCLVAEDGVTIKRWDLAAFDLDKHIHRLILCNGIVREMVLADKARRCGAPDDGPGCSECDEEPPPCARAMGCLCAGHARGNPTTDPCDTRENPY